MKKIINRREFILKTALGSVAFAYGFNSNLFGLSAVKNISSNSITKIALQKTTDRKFGVNKVMGLLDYPTMQDKDVILKPNFNTSDPAPASTHNDTLSQIIKEIQNRDAKNITLAERSYQSFDEVIEEKGIAKIAEELGFEIKNLDTDDYTLFNRDGLHWKNGFRVPNVISNADYIVTTCCLKTHFKGCYYNVP